MSVLLWLAAVAVLLWPLLERRALRPGPPREVVRDELVKDPVCQTYVVRSRAVNRREAGEDHYFCSAECARRYVLER